jgi:hypothetical protein
MQAPTLVGVGGWGDTRSGPHSLEREHLRFYSVHDPAMVNILLTTSLWLTGQVIQTERQPSTLLAINSAVEGTVVGMADDYGPARSNATRPIHSARPDVCACIDTAQSDGPAEQQHRDDYAFRC